MKRAVILSVIFMVLLLVAFIITVKAQDSLPENWTLTACVDNSVDAMPILQFGYSLTGEDEYGYMIADELISDQPALHWAVYFYPGTEPDATSVWGHDGNTATWTVTIGDVTQSITASADTTPECGLDLRYGADGGWTEVVSCGVESPFHWEHIEWGTVNGETTIQEDGCTVLILAHDNPDQDPAHYWTVYDG